MAQPTNVIELFPNDIDFRRGLMSPDLVSGILVVMVSNPSLCGYCRQAEPDFHLAADMSRGLEMVKFATVHLDSDEWVELDPEHRQILLDHICPENSKIPDYSFIVNGKVSGWKPVDRQAGTLHSMAQQFLSDIINDNYYGPAEIRKPYHGGSWYNYNEDDDYEDDQDTFDTIMANLDLDSIYGYDDDRLLNNAAPGYAPPSYQNSSCSSYGFCN